MTSRLRTIASTLALAMLALVTFAGPAGAQQPIDATEQGGEAFILFTVMCALFVASIFYMDRIRRRRSGED